MKPRILLVDDHDIVRHGIRTSLDTHCEICAEANNGREAIDLAAQLKPDLILMDISMPLMNGLEATRQIRRMEVPAKIVILSMHDGDQIVRNAYDAGADACLSKTGTAAELLRTIRKLLEK